MRVLVVEDDARIASDVSRALESSGYVVEIATSGEDAWFRGDTEDYGAVILDLGLPHMDGLAVLKRWRTNRRHMPVLILTARGSRAERVEGIDAGADDYLPKPFRALPSKYLRINSRLRSLRRILRQSPLRLLGITGDRECCAPACSREASCPNLNASRPSFHSLQLSAPPVRSARPR